MPQKGRRNADHNLLMAFACGATIESAAHSAGVSQSTALGGAAGGFVLCEELLAVPDRFVANFVRVRRAHRPYL